MNRRYTMRKSANPESEPPKSIRSSNLAQWFWCAEMARLYVMKMIPEDDGPKDAADEGTLIHKVLEDTMGRRFPWEEDFMKALEKYKDPLYGFARKVMSKGNETLIYADLTGHPDDFQITPDNVVAIVEHKTVGAKAGAWFIERYKLPMARFQSQLYSFILEPFVERLGGVMSRYNAVVYWRRPDEGKALVPFKSYPIEYRKELTKEAIATALAGFANPASMDKYKPQEWKCDHCFKDVKPHCQFHGDNV